MKVLLHFHFALSAAAPESEGAESAEVLRRGLQPFLAWLDFAPEMKASASFSGLLLEDLPEQTLALIRTLNERGQLEILLSPFYDPCMPLISPEEQKEQLDLGRSFWAAANVKVGAGMYLEHGLSAAEIPNYNEAGVSYIATPQKSFRETGAQLLAYVGGVSPTILFSTAVEDAPLSEYLPGVKQLLKFPAADDSRPFAAATFRISASQLLPEKLNPFEMRNAYLEMFKSLRGEAAKATGTGNSIIGPLPGGEIVSAGRSFSYVEELSPLLAPPPVQANPSREQQILAARLRELRDDLAPVPTLIQTMANELTNRERLKSVRRLYLRTQNAEFALATPEQFLAHRLRKAVYDAVIRAQVELDVIIHPEVDPLHGWITHALKDRRGIGTPEVVADSQLKRLYFDPSLAGALVGFEYKPRKANLSNTVDAKGRNLSFIDGVLELPPGQLSAAGVPKIAELLIPAQGEKAEPLVTRQTLDLFGLRMTRTLVPRMQNGPGKSAMNLVKHYTVKAGIGAYLNNATTGLSVESWVEGDAAPNTSLFLVSQFCFGLPSGNPEGMSIRPLRIAGGTADTAMALSELRFVENSDVEGGLYGTRLIDGINGFVMDLRSAKPVNAVAVFPLFGEAHLPEEDRCGGVTVLFFIELRRVYGDDKANTIFLSIM